MYAQLPRFETRLPARRTLERDHGHLARMLRPGISVLDVGCANGAITAGIAEAVGPDGNVVGVDRDALRLDFARSEHSALTNLQFEVGDATSVNYHGRFDIVTAALPQAAGACRTCIRSLRSLGLHRRPRRA